MNLRNKSISNALIAIILSSSSTLALANDNNDDATTGVLKMCKGTFNNIFKSDALSADESSSTASDSTRSDSTGSGSSSFFSPGNSGSSSRTTTNLTTENYNAHFASSAGMLNMATSDAIGIVNNFGDDGVSINYNYASSGDTGVNGITAKAIYSIDSNMAVGAIAGANLYSTSGLASGLGTDNLYHATLFGSAKFNEIEAAAALSYGMGSENLSKTVTNDVSVFAGQADVRYKFNNIIDDLSIAPGGLARYISHTSGNTSNSLMQFGPKVTATYQVEDFAQVSASVATLMDVSNSGLFLNEKGETPSGLDALAVEAGLDAKVQATDEMSLALNLGVSYRHAAKDSASPFFGAKFNYDVF